MTTLMRMFSAKSMRGLFFVGRLVTNSGGNTAAIDLRKGAGGYDTEEEARYALENTEPVGAESYLLLRVVDEYRPRHSLIQVLPADGDECK